MNNVYFNNCSSNSKDEWKLKCGEIYINKNENEMVLSCTNCDVHYLSLECFSKHYFSQHFVKSEICELSTSRRNVNVKDSLTDYSDDNILETENYTLDEYDGCSKTEKQCTDEMKQETSIPEKKASHEEKRTSSTHTLDIKEILTNCSEKFEFQPEKLVSNEYACSETKKNQAKRLIKKKSSFNLDKKISYRQKKAKNKQLDNKKSGRKKIPEGYFKCVICSEVLKLEEKVEHVKIHQHSSRFICETCGKGVKNKYQLGQHMKTHTGERPYKCQICLATFKCKHTLKGHERTHLDYKPFKCSICDMLFKSKRTAQQHELRHQAPTEANIECDLCGKKFNTQTKMMEHRGRHKEEKKPFQCPKCPKSFQTKYACSAHERLEHKGEYNYKCSYCDKLFIKNAMKKSHEYTHTRVGQPFPCNLCPKKYATREGLYKHKKRDHVMDKPLPDFKCHKCEKVFKLQSEYIEHCRKHALEEHQFICSVCGSNFVNEINLNNHINVIHNVRSNIVK
ncbi:zinc finger protein 567-like [Condylostylus longicornis]|uniref:zinc finger protein 567-like n=1 Tax=Condylostylus longicornis TaxID=2530218 RepID=UPI00244E0425|nr:zinc finger protein 567-like [Condylostylus longicornis]